MFQISLASSAYYEIFIQSIVRFARFLCGNVMIRVISAQARS